MIKEALVELAEGRWQFADVLAMIDQQYSHTPTAFKNGAQQNAASENQGSAKLLYFAQLNQLSESDTLALFAEHYKNVLDNPEATNHQNIRQFIQHGWAGVSFEGIALQPK